MRTIARSLFLLAFMAGLVTVGDGLWLRGKAAVAQILLVRAWAAGRDGESPHKPWPWADFTPIARLSVPGRGIAMIVLDGVSGQALAFGPGRHPALGRPGAPEPVLIAGHRDTHFRFLHALEIGDPLTIETRAGEVIHYRVAERLGVEGTRIRLHGAGSSTLILSTCLPSAGKDSGGERRLVVVAERSSV